MIRAATPDDAGAIAAIWNPLIRDTLVTFNPVEKTTADLHQMLDDKAAAGHAFLVACDPGGAILGFATYGQFRAGAGYRHTMEHTILLADGAQGRGMGRALMAGIEDHARAGGAKSLFAGVSAGNPVGVAFHAAIGFRQMVVLPSVGFKFGQWWDLVLMQKMLA